MTGLSELIARVEKATWPDREIDAEVAFALGIRPDGYELGEVFGYDTLVAMRTDEGGVHIFHPDEYTRSLDAVVALVERELPGGGWQVQSPRLTIATFCTGGIMLGRDFWAGHAATPALALLLAFLRAKEARG